MSTARQTEQPPAAFLFDLDGTLIDSVYQNVIAWRSALAKLDIDLSVWRIHRRIGMSGGLFVSALLPGARELLSALGLPAGTPMVTRDMVAHAKPDPDLFLAAAAMIGADPGHSWVVGDSVWVVWGCRRALVQVMQEQVPHQTSVFQCSVAACQRRRCCYTGTMTEDTVAAQMRQAATALLRQLDDQQRQLGSLPFTDDASRRWIEYRPEGRPGACLAFLSPDARKAAHRLLATALSDRAFAQVMAIVALEEVLDRREAGALRRHIGGYWVTVFGDPASGDAWSWRFEGHHVSVTMTVVGDAVSPTPVFLGANPARVTFGGHTVSRPLAPEEDIGLALLREAGPAGRSVAVVASEAPPDIRTATQPRAQAELHPLGVPATGLGLTARALLDELVALYLERLVPPLADREADRIAGGELYFAWEGPALPGSRHYYRVQGDDLLIEYDNTDDGNHAHTVLRRPLSDFGDDILAAHYGEEHAT